MIQISGLMPVQAVSICMHRSKQCFSHYTLNFPDVNKMNGILSLLFEDTDGSFWFGTKGAGFIHLGQKKQYHKTNLKSGVNNSLSGNHYPTY